jgi:hypothetical protein
MKSIKITLLIALCQVYLNVKSQTVFIPSGPNLGGISTSSNSNVGIGTSSPTAFLDISRTTSFAGPIFKIVYPWDKPEIFQIDHPTSKIVAIGNGGGTYSHGSIELFAYINLVTQSKIKFSASPLVDSYFNAGNLGIGVTSTNGYKLAVNGSIFATSLRLRATWPDYVFDQEYALMSLKDLELYIKINKHLPGIPTEQEVNVNGFDVSLINAKLLEKIEELTIHIIKLNKDLETLKEEYNKDRKK